MMAKTTRILWFFAILMLCANSVAKEQPDTQSLYQLLSPIKGLSAQFSQKIFNTDGDLLQTSSGELTAAEPNKIRWIVKQPMIQKIIGNGTQLWIYDPDLEQVIVQPFADDIAASPISLFAGNLKELDEAYSVIYHPTGDSILTSYILTPKSTGAIYTTLRIDFTAGTNNSQIPKAIKFVDSLNQTTHIELHDMVINPPLSDDLFTFKIPPGIDVVNHAN